MRSRPFVCVLCALAAALCAPPPALAADGETYPTAERVITETEATSTCIGDPRTPVCAVETLLACIARSDRELCYRAGVRDYFPGGAPEDYRYRILSVRILTEADMTPDLADAEWWKPEYADVTIQEPDFQLDFCDPGGCKASYNLKPSAIGWEIMTWFVWGVEKFEDDY